MTSPRISVVVPTLGEAGVIEAAMRRLQPLRREGHEIIVADGGSFDGTASAASPWVDALVSCEPGRAIQMNAGAAASTGDILLFLHVDTALPDGAAAAIVRGLANSQVDWGRFDVRLSGANPLFRIIERLISWRSRLTGVATGDQGIFVRRETFFAAGGFPPQPLLEDVALSATLKRWSRPLCLHECVTTSSRRWERRGIARTVVLMWRIRAAYAFGAEPGRLARAYRES